MIAAKTTVPVLGVPVASRHLQGVDSLHSIVQMPKGMPVATFAIGTAGAANAALFAVALLANENPRCASASEAFRAAQTEWRAQHDLAARRMGPTPSALLPGHPGRARRRPARPHVRACSAGHGYFTAVLDADRKARRPGEPPPHPDRLRRPRRPGQAGGAERRRHHRVRERAAVSLAALAGQCPWPRQARRGVAQDRAQEKAHFVRCGVPCAPYAVIETAEQLGRRACRSAAGHLKTARLGYDGKGPGARETAAELAAAWGLGRPGALRARKMLPLQLECSVIVARGADGP